MKKKDYSKVIMSIILLTIAAITPPKVTAQNSTPYFTYSPITPRVGDIVTFDASEFEAGWPEINGTLIWHFGDGGSATGASVNHSYASPGTYGAGVLAADETGDGASSEKSINVREQTPVTVYISLSDKFIQTGQEVTINGNLTYTGSGVQDEWINLRSITYIEGAQWNNIATVKTDEDGQYSFDWKAFYGYYRVQAKWEGNSTYPETSISVILIVETFGDLINEFYSNSTITGMNYNVTTRILRFSAEGPSGTTGYTKIYIRKDLNFDPEKINVLFDGQPIGYTITSSDQIWILEFTYTHSIHNVEVNFDMYSTFTPSPSPEPTPTASTTPTSSPSPTTTLTPTPEQSLRLPSTIEIVAIVILVVIALGLAVNMAKKRKNPR